MSGVTFYTGITSNTCTTNISNVTVPVIPMTWYPSTSLLPGNPVAVAANTFIQNMQAQNEQIARLTAEIEKLKFELSVKPVTEPVVATSVPTGSGKPSIPLRALSKRHQRIGMFVPNWD